VPTKVYGTMEIAEHLVIPGRALIVPLFRQTEIEFIELEVAVFYKPHCNIDDACSIFTGESELALKYDGDEPFDKKLERLRCARGFTEGVEFE
jgi:hypothetical protein